MGKLRKHVIQARLLELAGPWPVGAYACPPSAVPDLEVALGQLLTELALIRGNGCEQPEPNGAPCWHCWYCTRERLGWLASECRENPARARREGRRAVQRLRAGIGD